MTEAVHIEDPTRGRQGASLPSHGTAMRPTPDARHLSNGFEIPTITYSDQPFVVKTDDGAWLCVLTTGSGLEGEPGQHVISTRSMDQGRTWSDPVAVEPPSGVESSYAVLLKTPKGRIYCFYNHNTDNVRWIVADNPPYPEGKCYRVDSLGYFVYKYSDDHGRSWSEQRYPIPVREMEIDRRNPYEGKIRFFWNVGRPFVRHDAAFVSLHKVGGIGNGFFTSSEGVLLKSDNILTEDNPERIRWETLPDGEIGLRTPPGGGPVAEEQSYSLLSDGSVFCIYRTIDGHPTVAYSRDGAHTWTTPEYARYANGRLIKHPRAANFAWRCENGKYLYWYHNHGGKWYEDRNPVWLCGGIEVDSPEGKVIHWSQPEIVLYEDDPFIRMSYPDLVEDGGHYYLTETQKTTGRVHLLDNALVEGLWAQFDPTGSVTQTDCILDWAAGQPDHVQMPKLPEFSRRDPLRTDHGSMDLRTGFTIEMWLSLDSLDAGQILFEKRADQRQGVCVQTTPVGTLEIILNDGMTESRWDCDPGMLTAGMLHHVTIVVDGGPKIITFIVDGVLCDGGEVRMFGWGRFNALLRYVHSRVGKWVTAPGTSTDSSDSVVPTQDQSMEEAAIAPAVVRRLRVYSRALRTSEVISHFKAGVHG
ncbi:MAG: hypothetical protein IPK19_08785 [Chloroflexi bacterium]|nr:hypothetical protein [Chloroflexota bacterium]